MINEAWLDLPSFSRASFSEPGISDYSPAVLKLLTPQNSGPNPFKYFNHWSSLPNFPDTVQKIWSIHSPRNAMSSLFHKLRCLKKELRSFSQDEKRIINNLDKLKRKLCEV